MQQQGSHRFINLFVVVSSVLPSKPKHARPPLCVVHLLSGEIEAAPAASLHLKHAISYAACVVFSSQDLTRQAALRQVAIRVAQRSREAGAAAFQRWRLATAAAVVEKLRQQERAGSVGRGAAAAEAALKRRDAGRVSAGFRRWREADAEVGAGERVAGGSEERWE